MNLGMLLDMAADGFGDRVVIGRRNGGLTAEQLRAKGGRRSHRRAFCAPVVPGRQAVQSES